jgi:hypothetical protein
MNGLIRRRDLGKISPSETAAIVASAMVMAAGIPLSGEGHCRVSTMGYVGFLQVVFSLVPTTPLHKGQWKMGHPGLAKLGCPESTLTGEQGPVTYTRIIVTHYGGPDALQVMNTWKTLP